MLRTYAAVFNSRNLLMAEFRPDLIEHVVKLAGMDPYKRIPVIKMNHALYMFSRYKEKEEYFFLFVDLLEKYPMVYSKEEISEDISSLLINYCVIKNQQGFKKFVKVKFELFKKLMSEKFLGSEEYLRPFLFNNIITSALQNNDLQYAENFIEEYKRKLPPGNENIIELSYARLQQYLKQYDNVLERLSKIKDSEDIFLKLMLKDFYVKTFYEKGDYEQVFSLIDSYKHFLHNNPLISREIKERYHLYLKMTGELLKVKLSPGKDKLLELKHALEKTPGLVHRDWICEKLDEI
jgi:hypothetical protein